MSKVKISKVVLDVRGKKIELDLNEARELRNILNDTFPTKEVQSVPVYIPQPYPMPYQPYKTWWSYTDCETITDHTLCLSVSEDMTTSDHLK